MEWPVSDACGSQLLDPAPYSRGNDPGALVLDPGHWHSHPATMDWGGGLGIAIGRGTLEAKGLARRSPVVVRSAGAPFSAGRYLVGSAGIRVRRLIQQARRRKSFVIVDAGMSELVRPSRYNAHHEIVVAQERGKSVGPVDVVGPICETGDYLALDRPLPSVDRGEVLAILGAGAYGFVMSSTYNARPRAPEVIADRGRWAVARPRETLEELMQGERADCLPPGAAS